MQTILSSIVDEDDDICKQLQLDLLAIWRKEHNISPMAYEFSKGLIEQKIERFKKQMTENELISMGLQDTGPPKKSKNQMRREQIFFACQETWTPDHNCGVSKEDKLGKGDGPIRKENEEQIASEDDLIQDGNKSEFQDTCNEEHASSNDKESFENDVITAVFTMQSDQSNKNYEAYDDIYNSIERNDESCSNSSLMHDCLMETKHS
ncbi:hypothetical protein SUGI_0955770 [Cryptomeria japonica]|nr:hypothetical protein SUGI_0955770 [Cryptomeria japonica]